MNGLDDVAMIQALYRASQAGVRIDLIVRGHTRLRPGVSGVSERIRLRSIVGRFLEHDRIFWFENGGNPDVLIGSADWRRRNLEERVEAVVRIQDHALKARLGHILDLALADNRLAWELMPDGAYRLCEPAEGEPVRSYQDTLMQEALGPERSAPASSGEQSVQIA
jgi:polyphosphate kinase